MDPEEVASIQTHYDKINDIREQITNMVEIDYGIFQPNNRSLKPIKTSSILNMDRQHAPQQGLVS